MKNRFTYHINYLAVVTAFTSSIIGIICLVLCKNNSQTGFFALGYFYMLLAGLLNVIFLFLVLINIIQKRKAYPEHIKTIFLILLNSPIVLAYLEIV